MAQHFAQAYPYAEALFAIAKEGNCYSDWRQILAALSFIAEQQEVLELLQNPAVNKQQIYDLLLNVLKPNLTKAEQEKQTQILLELLVKNQRVAITPEIEKLFKKLQDEEENIAEATVTSALELDSAQKEQLKAALEKRLAKTLLLEYTTDKTLVGGVKVQIGDTVFDGTIATQLAKLKAMFRNIN